MGLVRVFALQQAASNDPPLLIIEDAHDLNPSALRAVCELAELRVRPGQRSEDGSRQRYDRWLRSCQAPAMQADLETAAARLSSAPDDAQRGNRIYLHEKLRAAGADFPAFIFPNSVCDALWEASGGWPGVIDRIALLALAKADTLPVPADVIEHPALPTGTWIDESADEPAAEAVTTCRPSPPQIVVSASGSVIQELTMQKAATPDRPLGAQ